MNKDIKKLQDDIKELQKTVRAQGEIIKKLSDTSYKTASREIINREIQFMQKCYNKDGTLIGEINT